ncbi:MAG TPA: hypothetical protein VEY11_13470 [Pyrinomonadaceae bacterium]|nr:hypothetical protein [Pyrinomonadaceae bacterium]
MTKETTELFVIGIAMLFFLLISGVAVWIFVRQYRREHKRDEDSRE